MLAKANLAISYWFNNRVDLKTTKICATDTNINFGNVALQYMWNATENPDWPVLEEE